MYEANKEYHVRYFNDKGEEQEYTFTPEQTLNRPQLITKLKKEKKDFFKLIECKLKKGDLIMENLSKKSKNNLDVKIKPWYMKEYNDDELGQEISDDVTFQNIIDALNEHAEIYDVIGVWDSIVRERIFDKLSSLSGLEYDDIFHKWLEESKKVESEENDFEELLDADETEEEVSSELSEIVEEIKEDIEPEMELSLKATNNAIDVLLVDEEGAIKGYEDYLAQAKSMLIPPLYKVLENEINEIIEDEKEHIVKLEAIKNSFNLDIVKSQEDVIEESVQEGEETLGMVLKDLLAGKYNTDMAEIIDAQDESDDYTYVATQLTYEGEEFFKDILALPVIEKEMGEDELYITVDASSKGLLRQLNKFLRYAAGYVASERYSKLFVECKQLTESKEVEICGKENLNKIKNMINDEELYIRTLASCLITFTDLVEEDENGNIPDDVALAHEDDVANLPLGDVLVQTWRMTGLFRPLEESKTSDYDELKRDMLYEVEKYLRSNDINIDDITTEEQWNDIYDEYFEDFVSSAIVNYMDENNEEIIFSIEWDKELNKPDIIISHA